MVLKLLWKIVPQSGMFVQSPYHPHMCLILLWVRGSWHDKATWPVSIFRALEGKGHRSTHEPWSITKNKSTQVPAGILLMLIESLPPSLGIKLVYFMRQGRAQKHISILCRMQCASGWHINSKSFSTNVFTSMSLEASLRTKSIDISYLNAMCISQAGM